MWKVSGEVKLLKTFLICAALLIIAVISVIFTDHNEQFYHRTIGKVVKVMEDPNNSKSEQGKLYQQTLSVRILNGIYKGNILTLDNSYSMEGAYDYHYHKGDNIFLSLTSTVKNATTKNTSLKNISVKITGVKRDYYLVITGWIFLLFILIIGRKRGLYSAISLFANVLIFSYALDLYRKGMNLVFLCSVLAIIFTAISMIMVLGRNRKSYAAILSTLLATIITMVITYIVLFATKKNGLRFEEMQYITRPMEPIFISGILLGSLGAIMDIAITITSSLYEMNHEQMSGVALINSGKEIGRDIMGSMCNVLLLAYVSGSIPMILLYSKNGMSLFQAFYANLSLELARALTGSIGIVLSIPISIYTTLFFMKKKK